MRPSMVENGYIYLYIYLYLYEPLNHQAWTISYDTSSLYLIYISLLKLYLQLVSHYHGEMYGLESLLASYFYIKNSGPLNHLRVLKIFKVSHKCSIASSVQASFLVFPRNNIAVVLILMVSIRPKTLYFMLLLLIYCHSGVEFVLRNVLYLWILSTILKLWLSLCWPTLQLVALVWLIVESWFVIWVRHDFIFEVTIFKSLMERTYPSAFEYDSQINCLWTVDAEIE